MTETKEKTLAEKTAEQLRAAAEAIEQMGEAFSGSAYATVSGDNVQVWPGNENAARRIVGALTRMTGKQPTVFKWGATNLEAGFEHKGMRIAINGYRGRNCRIERKAVEHPAEPEKIIPAKPATTEMVDVLVCDDEGTT